MHCVACVCYCIDDERQWTLLKFTVSKKVSGAYDDTNRSEKWDSINTDGITLSLI